MTTWNLSEICTCGLKRRPCKRHIEDDTMIGGEENDELFKRASDVIKAEYDRIILRDTWDEDIFHFGYRWHKSKLTPTKFSQRTAMTIHIDDIEGMFGEPMLLFAKSMKLGEWEFIRFVDDGALPICDDNEPAKQQPKA